jgi:membrane-bound serine protease (ClpP class)
MFVGLALFVFGSLRRVRNAPVLIGEQAMRGLSARVLDWSEHEGHVFAQGERWQARSTEAFTPGETVEVANVIDLTLVVRRRPALAGEGGPT